MSVNVGKKYSETNPAFSPPGRYNNFNMYGYTTATHDYIK